MDNRTMISQELEELAALKELHKGKGVAATILGIVSLIACLGPVSFICGIIAIIIGANARKKSRKTTGTAGLVMGCIGVGLSIIGTILIVAVLGGILVPTYSQYNEKAEVAGDMQICDTVYVAILTALYDPSSQDEESLEFIEYYGDGYYYDLSYIYDDDCAFAENVKDMLGYDSYYDLCDSLDSKGAYGIEFAIDGYNVSTRVSGTDIEIN